MSITIEVTPHQNPRMDAMTEVQRLRWVLEFIRRDLTAESSERLEAMGDDLQHATAPWWVKKPVRYGMRCTELPGDAVSALQQEIRECVQTVMGDSVDVVEMSMRGFGHVPPKGWVLPEAATRLLRVRFHRDDRRGRILCVRDNTNVRIAVLNGVVSLLQRFGERLDTCPVCGAPFLHQYRQAYCQVRCSNKVRNKRRLDRHAHQRKTGRLADDAPRSTSDGGPT